MTNKHIRLSNTDGAKVIKVIRVESLVGEGTAENPARQITEYFSLKGKRLARVDYQNEVEDIHKWENLTETKRQVK